MELSSDTDILALVAGDARMMAVPAPRQALEDIVLLGRRHDFLKHIAGHRQVIAELEQLQCPGRVDSVALGGICKDQQFRGISRVLKQGSLSRVEERRGGGRLPVAMAEVLSR